MRTIKTDIYMEMQFSKSVTDSEILGSVFLIRSFSIVI